MKIRDLHPSVTPWRDGQCKVAHAWRLADTSYEATEVRRVFHYETLMIEFWRINLGSWQVLTPNIGWGSVSDQNGIAELAYDSTGAWRMSRAGGVPRLGWYPK